jgi:3-phenylpropionate/trans-cinnamate dioxygenase ferredoxin reductase subunit
VIATGAVARQIPLLPPDMPGVHYLRTEGDAHRLKQALANARRLLVVGGGLIGLEVAASAATMGVETVVVEVAPRILSRVADDGTAAAVHAEHERHGVRILVGVGLVAVDSQPDGEIAVALSTGQTLGADVIVVGTGAKPNDALAAEAGLTTDDGVVVDDRCRTSDPAIFAAGDVVRFPGPHGSIRLENWRHAQDQGAVAGRNAAGGDERYITVPSFWSEQYDLYIQGVGWPAPGATRVERPGPGSLLFDVKDGRLVYAMGINAQRDLAAARRLIERQVPVDEAALADPSRPLAAMLKR